MVHTNQSCTIWGVKQEGENTTQIDGEISVCTVDVKCFAICVQQKDQIRPHCTSAAIVNSFVDKFIYPYLPDEMDLSSWNLLMKSSLI